MKFTDSLVAMVGDFAAMKRTPDYIPSSCCVESPSTKPEMKKPNEVRRHSLLISVGTQEIPKLGRLRSESVGSRPAAVDAKRYNKVNRRLSEPCVPMPPTSSLRKKMQKLKEKGSESDDDTIKEVEEEDVPSTLEQRRMSSGSFVYRI